MTATGHGDELEFIRRAAKLISKDELEVISIFDNNKQFAAFCTACTLGAPDDDLRKMLVYRPVYERPYYGG